MTSDPLGWSLMRQAKQNLVSSGSLTPVLLIEGRESVLLGIADMPRTSDDRQALMFSLGRRFSSLRPRRITMVMDAHMKVSKEGIELPLKQSLADDPASTDCLMVASLSNRQRSVMAMCPYERIPTLDGLEIKSERVRLDGGYGKLYLLEAFFEGAQPA